MPKGTAEPKFEIIRGGKLHSLDLFRRQETDTWALADAVATDVIEKRPTLLTERDVNRKKIGGVYGLVEGLRLDLAVEGVEQSHGYLKLLYETSDSWNPDDRFEPKAASFTAHSELRALGYPNRREILQRIIDRNGGRASQRDVKRWRYEQKPKPVAKSWAQKLADNLHRALVRELGQRPTREMLQVAIDTLADQADELTKQLKRR
jgi:hypothetical protein